jgi:hypothetical protein
VFHPRLIGTLGCVIAASTPVVAAATTSHAKLWQNTPHTVTCGVKIHPSGTKAKVILCGAKGVPRPKGGGSTGDPFVQISAKGHPHLVLISQNSFAGTTLVTLAPGKTWSKLGVTCKVATTGHTVRCHNGSSHGFKIGNGAYHAF